MSEKPLPRELFHRPGTTEIVFGVDTGPLTGSTLESVVGSKTGGTLVGRYVLVESMRAVRSSRVEVSEWEGSDESVADGRARGAGGHGEAH